MTKHGLTLSMALALSTSLAGVAFAQGAPQAQAPGSSPTPMGVHTAAPAGQPAMNAPGAASNPGSAGMNTAPGSMTAAPGSMTTAPGSMSTAPGGMNAATRLSAPTIKQAQQQLKMDGLYKGSIDGRMGPETRSAVRQFQHKHGLNTTARLDRQTLDRQLQKQAHG